MKICANSFQISKLYSYRNETGRFPECIHVDYGIGAPRTFAFSHLSENSCDYLGMYAYPSLLCLVIVDGNLFPSDFWWLSQGAVAWTGSRFLAENWPRDFGPASQLNNFQHREGFLTIFCPGPLFDHRTYTRLIQIDHIAIINRLMSYLFKVRSKMGAEIDFEKNHHGPVATGTGESAT